MLHSEINARGAKNAGAAQNKALVVHTFAEGGAHITTTTALARYKARGSTTYGNPNDGLFLSPMSDINSLLLRARNRTDIEVALGLVKGQLQSGKLI